MIDALTNGLAQVSSPAYLLMLDDKDITENIAPRLISLTIEDNRGFTADTLTLVLSDADGDIQLPQRDTKIRVFIGEKGYALVGLGEFVIDQVKHDGAPDKVTVLGRSADFNGKLNKEHEQSWHDTTLGAIVEEIAKRCGLEASVAESLKGIKIAHIDQSMESDASFLHRLAVRNGAEPTVKWNKLMLIKPGRGLNAKGEAFPQVVIQRSDGDKHSFNIADRSSYTGVTARWLDTQKPKNQTQKVQLQRKTTTQTPASTEHPRAVTPAAEQSEKPVYVAGSADNVYGMSTVYASKEEAKRAADGLWHHIQRNTATFSLTLARGRTDITPETPVRVSGFKTVIDDTPWTIKKVTHSLDNNGFVSKLDLEVKIEEGQYDVQNE